MTTTNTGTATGDAGDTTVTDDDDATVTVTPHAPAIHVEKTASLIAVQTPGGPVTYTFVVTNTGNVPLTDRRRQPMTSARR